MDFKPDRKQPSTIFQLYRAGADSSMPITMPRGGFDWLGRPNAHSQSGHTHSRAKALA